MRILRLDGWEEGRKTTHGISYSKMMRDNRRRVTIVPDKRRSLRPGTLRAILDEKQAGIGFDGLEALIKQHGLK